LPKTPKMQENILDTNIFIRFLIHDIDDQFKKAKDILEKIEQGEVEGQVSILVINEMIWILENFYDLKRDIYIPEILKLLALKNMKIIEVSKDLIIKILEQMQENKIDFTDLYLFNIAKEKKNVSFDQDHLSS
jgi:predicted nucleic acid-binding protein